MLFAAGSQLGRFPLAGPSRVQYEPLPDSRAGVDQTVARMREVLRAPERPEEHSLSLREATEDALAAAGWPETDLGKAEAIYTWLLDHYQYLRDAYGVEELRDPGYALGQISRRGTFAGDCDDATILLGRLYRTIDLPIRAGLASVETDEPSHVFLAVETEEGWLPADPIRRQPFGTMIPGIRHLELVSLD